MTYELQRAWGVLAEDGVSTLARKGLESVLRRMPRTGVPLYYRLRARRNWHRSGDYTARPDPFAVVRVPVEDIVYNTGRRFSYMGNRYADGGLVAGGDWDRELDRFGERAIYAPGSPETIYRSFVERFEEGRDWEAVPFVRAVLDDLESRDPQLTWHGCTSREEVLARCLLMDRLFRDIETNGYRSKRELFEDDPDAPATNPQRFHYLHDEVTVNVGRDGRLLFVGGHHRLSIARVLDLSEIPVRLFVRHRDWQELRDRVHAGAEPPADLRAHPDLQDVL
jgi:hypothetical protein